MKKISSVNFRHLYNFVVNSLFQFNANCFARFTELRYDFRFGRAKIDCDISCIAKYASFERIVELPVVFTFTGVFDLNYFGKSEIDFKYDVALEDDALYELLEGQNFEPSLLILPFRDECKEGIKHSGIKDFYKQKEKGGVL